MTVRKSVCALCGNGCGLELTVEDNRIVRARGDREDPRSGGYTCRKALQIKYHQHHADRLLHPLKRVGDGFERISWDQAIAEIAAKLGDIVDRHGPRSLVLAGGGTLACPAQGPFAVGLLRALGSQYYYNSIAQELTGRYWADGEMFGDQNMHTSADTGNADMAIISGKNPMMSHHSPRARIVWKEFGRNPHKLLVVIDPRRTETAKLADIHLPLRPGTDALLLRAMIAIILQEGWQDRAFLAECVSDFAAVEALFREFDARAAIEVCELDYDQVREVCREFATRRGCYISDLGVLMNRHSTLVSYLENVLLAASGALGRRRGGNRLPRAMGGPRGAAASARQESWRTVATGFPPITGLYPPNVLPEEILNDHPDRVRAVIVSAHNPLRAWADTTAFETAFASLDLLVTVEIAMTETAALSHYVLPAPSVFEKWDGAGIAMRPPILEPEGEQLEEGEIFTRLADELGLLPELPEFLFEAARKGPGEEYNEALTAFLDEVPEAARRMPFILARTLGPQLGSAHLASLWGRMRNLPAEVRDRGFESVLDQATKGRMTAQPGEQPNEDYTFPELPTEDGKVRLNVPEMTAWLAAIDPATESAELEKDSEEFPFIISSGRHFDYNANTLMRDPEWNRGKRACTLIMHPVDAEKYQLRDGQMVRVIADGGEETIELEVDSTTREGYTMIPHGFGLLHAGATYGANANRITRAEHRDPIAGTPLHRYIRCRVEPVV